MRIPPIDLHPDSYQPRDIDALSMVVSDIKRDGKGVPALIKQYLKLNGRFLGFNIDRTFANVVDGLVIVDLLHAEARIIQRFMGWEGAQIYYRYHHRHCDPDRLQACAAG